MLFQKNERKKAVSYYRHSAEDKQENSVLIQREKAEQFARQYQIDIIHEEADEGKSGLNANRPGFDKLINHYVLSPEAPDFNYILVYDVSRWGRFQDPDEAAYYEMLCKKRGKKVIYISRGFPREEERLLTTLQTPIERYMAAEYSRQLSEKVFNGCVKVSQQGYSAGGTAPYGMVRLLLDENKKPLYPLKRGEHKAIDNQRVTFAPANDETSDTVREIFRLLVKDWYTPNEIAEYLNQKGILSANGFKWTRDKIIRILTNETYIGTRIYNKTWHRLKEKMRSNPREEWVITPNAFDAVIDQETFRKAQENLYWLMPSKWKRGIYRLQRTQKIIQQHVEGALKEHIDFNSDSIWETIRNLPVVLGVTFYRESVPYWCFYISESMRQFDEVIGVAVDLYRHSPIDKFFLVQTTKFTMTNYLVISAKDIEKENNLIDPKNIESELLRLCGKMSDDKSVVTS
jgi:DNA invertase Pin-like site-specific DNA recombinase